MARFQDILRDQNQAEIAGGFVTVRNYPSGTLAPITDDAGALKANPITTDAAGAYYFNAQAGLYTLEFRLTVNEVVRKIRMVDLGDTLLGSYEVLLGNPGLTAGLVAFGSDGLGTKANQREAYTFTGSRTTPMVGRTIEISDDQTGPASSNGTSTANSASYALARVNIRLNWNTSTKTGEVDGGSVFVRNGQGDTAGELYNVGVRNGFGVCTEGYTFSADSAGAEVRAVRTQAGVVNPRDGGYFGYTAQAAVGTDLDAAFLAWCKAGAAWIRGYMLVDASFNILAQIRASDGAYIGGSLTPRVDLGAQIGTSILNYANVYTLKTTLKPASISTLGTAAANEGALAYCNDVTGSPAVGAAVSGGGSGKLLVFSNGTNWLRVV